ncbi:hypothetical protein FIBSPDRAFT_261863 [Athelia psychrophila]|uniref:Uncharacterized protein n=1 Tax=Athelia psychrophila TaxID=1759441 RepID=A0A165XHY4_9AGAM|nr:hypothetical protein FIBSPDRAFT_261863 [Fibularhizoctonia sp. CBS 109695]
MWSKDAGRCSKREMEPQNYTQMLTQQLAAACVPECCHGRSVASDALQPATQTEPCYPPRRTASHPASMLQPPTPSSPLPVQHLSSRPRVGLRHNPNHPPRIHIQEAPRALGASSPTPAVHPAGVSHCASPAPAYTAEQSEEVPLQSPHPNHGYANHRSALSMFCPGRTNGAAPTRSGCSTLSASPIIAAGGIEGDGSPLGDRGRRREQTRIRTATRLDRPDTEGVGSGSGNSNADRDVSKADEEEEVSNVLEDDILKGPESFQDGSLGSLRRKASGNRRGRVQSIWIRIERRMPTARRMDGSGP